MIQTLKNVKEYKEELIRPAIREMLEALDIARDLRPGMKVVIKPRYGEKAGRAGDNPPAGCEGCGGMAPGAGD